VLTLERLLCNWLAGMAGRCGRANDYRLLVVDVARKGPFLEMWGVPTYITLPIVMQCCKAGTLRTTF
jgi:hypothetical protein